MDTVTVLYFAQASRATGCSGEQLAWSGGTVEDLLTLVVARHEGLAELAPSLRLAVDQAMSGSSDLVRPGQTVAVMPPFSGG